MMIPFRSLPARVLILAFIVSGNRSFGFGHLLVGDSSERFSDKEAYNFREQSLLK